VTLPQVVADEHHALRTRRILLAREPASQLRLDADRLRDRLLEHLAPQPQRPRVPSLAGSETLPDTPMKQPTCANTFSVRSRMSMQEPGSDGARCPGCFGGVNQTATSRSESGYGSVLQQQRS
jgi:hypothetical protein